MIKYDDIFSGNNTVNGLIICSWIRNLFAVFIVSKYAYKYRNIHNHITLHNFWLSCVAFHLSREYAYHYNKCRNTMLDDLRCCTRYSNWYIQEKIQLPKPFKNVSCCFMDSCVLLNQKYWRLFNWFSCYDLECKTEEVLIISPFKFHFSKEEDFWAK